MLGRYIFSIVVGVAVTLVADDRMARMLQMDADLVCPAGLRLASEETVDAISA